MTQAESRQRRGEEQRAEAMVEIKRLTEEEKKNEGSHSQATAEPTQLGEPRWPPEMSTSDMTAPKPSGLDSQTSM